MPEHAGEARGRNGERHRPVLAQHPGGRRPIRHVHQRPGHQADAVEGLAVAAQRDFLLRSPIDVIEEAAGDAPPRRQAGQRLRM